MKRQNYMQLLNHISIQFNGTSKVLFKVYNVKQYFLIYFQKLFSKIKT